MNLRILTLIGREAITLIASALIGSLVVFGLLRLLGGDVALMILGQDADPDAAIALREQLGLNRPLHVQYLDWIGGFLTGDLGKAYSGGYDIFDQIVARMGPTSLLAFGSLLVSILLALAVGTYSALNARRASGAVIDVLSQLAIAMPSFWAALLLVYLFAVILGWLPAGGYVPLTEDPAGSLRSLVLPVAALSLSSAAVKTRFVRSAMLDIMNEDYIRTAMAKGRTFGGAVLRHGLRNAAIPVVTISTLQLGQLLAGAIVLENVFVIPGLGRLLLVAVNGREVIVVQSLTFVILMIILAMNFLMDIAYGLLDPRIADKKAAAAHG
ncbi:MAG: ABC transporter permease [Alphaproteobacteria bacterium]|nr:ABC transporter permease [Alphaproteobacteria bacterium]